MANKILEGIKAISLDFWYTIARYESEAEWERQDRVRVKNFSIVLKKHGIELTIPEIEQTLEEVGTECEAERLTTEIEVSSREVVSRFLTRLGLRKRIAGGVTELTRVFDEALLEVKIVPERGAHDVLRELKLRGFPMALLSNTSHGHIIRRIMDREGLTRYFDHLIYSDEIGPRKPNPQAFKIMLKCLGTSPEETVHVGDRMELDVLGARRSHVRSVLYTEGGHCIEEGMPKPDFCIHDLMELLES